ncbi:MAG TPA: hypothetical protein DIW47_07650 [Bacteroidetes bacterium]|nr:hypothetical protein [Bacteroidota bacterium]
MIYRLSLALVLLLSLGLSSTETPDQLIWTERFESATTTWRTSNSLDELYLIQGGHYVLFRKNESGPSIILPENGDLYGECHVEMEMMLDPLVPGSSLGLMFMARPNGSAAYILEINDSREYRIRQIEESVFKELSGTTKNAGWIRDKVIHKPGEINRITATYGSGVIKFEINGKDVWVGDAYQPEKGKIGIYIGPGSKGQVDEIRVYVSQEEADRIKKDREDQDPLRAELTEIIISLRQTINAQNKEIDSLMKVSGQLQAEQSKFDNNPRNVKKLTAQIAGLEKEKRALEAKVRQLTKEVTVLKKFQDNIKTRQGGDIVIKLTNALGEEQDKNKELEKEKKELTSRLAALELELKTYKDNE